MPVVKRPARRVTQNHSTVLIRVRLFGQAPRVGLSLRLRLDASVSPPIGQPLGDNAWDRKRHAFRIGHLVDGVAEVQFCGVMVQMRIGDLMECPDNAALEDRKVILAVVWTPEMLPRISFCEWFTVPSVSSRHLVIPG